MADATPTPKPKLTPEQVKALQADLATLEAEEAELLGIEKPGLLAQAAQKGLSFLDYLGGFARTGVADVVGGAAGKSDVVTGEDYAKAREGEAPSTSEYLARAGVGEGGKLSDLIPGAYAEPGWPEWGGFKPEKGGMLDPSLRGAGGFAGDIALDPLTYLSFGGSGLLRKGLEALTKAKPVKFAADVAGAVTQPVRGASQAIGERMYKSAFPNLEYVGKRGGKEDIVETLQGQKMWGTAEGVSNQIQARMEKLAAARKPVLAAADAAGPVIDSNKAAAKGFELVQKMMDHPIKEREATVLQELLEKYAGKGNITASKATEYKTMLGEELKSPHWDPTTRSKSEIKVVQDLMEGYRKGAEEAAAKVSPELKKSLHDINHEWGNYLTIQRQALSDARKTAKARTLSRSDLAATSLGGLGAGIFGGTAAMGPAAIAAFGLKKAWDLGNTTLGKTGGGLLMQKFAKYPARIVDPIARREAIYLGQPEKNPWAIKEKK